MPIVLPPSLDKHVHTLEEELAHARTMTPEQRLEGVALACRAAMDLLAFNAKREEILAYSDPLPQSSIELLRRLRAQR